MKVKHRNNHCVNIKKSRSRRNKKRKRNKGIKIIKVSYKRFKN